jgi:hypothetical protein
VKSILFALALLFALNASLAAQSPGPWLVLPTENHALFSRNPENFYMFVERDFEGKKTRPWEGGMFGFTRSPRREGGQIVFTRFHEGIDIRPVRRNPAGEPLDPVAASANGVVVHVANDPGTSNYGRYVVVQHDMGGSPYFTLYAHLGPVRVKPGQVVRQGEELATLGYTGRGINRERAHLHFEFCMMVNRNFSAWFDHYLAGNTNHHGNYNGMNLLGMDPVGLLKSVRANPALTVPEFVRSLRPLFSIAVPDSRHFDLPRLYPWLMTSPGSNAPIWRVTFSDAFIPMRIDPETDPGGPVVRWLADGRVALAHQSRGLVSGTPSNPRLTESGQRFAHLLTFPDNLP